MCECHQIGGRFIAEDPDCPVHGVEAQRETSHRGEIIRRLDVAISYGTQGEILSAALGALEYLQSL